MRDKQNYDEAVKAIKTAILQSQYDAARTVNEKQLLLYYGIGKYISLNSRNGFWGKGAIDAISEQLDKELPGLRGFTSRNLRYMRTFYEEWKILDFTGQITNSKTEETAIKLIWNLQVPNCRDFPIDEFLHIGFTHHRVILGKIKNLPNNFVRTLPAGQQALKAIGTFKDEYLLDYINVEELDVREKADVDEKVVENAIIHNVKNFIL